MKEKYLLFVIDNCPFCDLAVAALEGEEYTIVDVSNDLVARSQTKKAFDWNTFPIILQKEGSVLKLIGGFTDLKEKVEAGGHKK